MKKKSIILMVSVLSIMITLIGGCATKQKSQAEIVNLAALKPVGIPAMQEKKAVFERVWGLFYENYPSFQLKVVNWEKEKEKYEPLALQASTWPQFFLVVNDMILTLHDPHCFLVGAPLPQEYDPYLLTTVVDNQLVVVAAPKTPQLKPGTVILGLNGKSITDCMDKLPLADWFSPLQWTTQGIFGTFSPSPENLTVLDPHTGDIRDVVLPVYKYSNYKDMLRQFIHIHQYYRMFLQDNIHWINWQSTLQVREMGDGILYIHIYRMSDNLDKQLQPYMAQILKAKGIIIDVRNNPGGESTYFAQHFYVKNMDPIVHRLAFMHELGQWKDNILPPLAPHISAPTAVLINGTDASAAELFAAEMEVAKNVRTFGTRTEGACEYAALHEVMDGVSIQVPSGVERVQLTGLPIEGVGIAPEVSVHESYPEFMKYLQLIEHNQNPDSADAVLQTAKKWVLSQMHN